MNDEYHFWNFRNCRGNPLRCGGCIDWIWLLLPGQPDERCEQWVGCSYPMDMKLESRPSPKACVQCQRDAEGKAWWSVQVWKTDGKDRIGAFTMKGLCATDGDAMFMATKWAKANIDRIAG